MEELFPRNGCNYQVENVFQKKKKRKEKKKKIEKIALRKVRWKRVSAEAETPCDRATMADY